MKTDFPVPICTKAAAIELQTDDVDEKERTVKARISTDRTDSDLDVVLPGGLIWDRFRKNPVVLFMHDPFGLPVGKSLWQKVGKREVVAKTQFAEHEFADEVFKMFVDGILRGWSIGMDPMSARRRDIQPSEIRKRPDWAGARHIIERAEVVEYSVATIPANEDALSKAFSKGLFPHVRPVLEFRQKGFDKPGPVSHTVHVGRPVRHVKIEPRLIRDVPLSVGKVETMINRTLRRVRGQL